MTIASSSSTRVSSGLADRSGRKSLRDYVGELTKNIDTRASNASYWASTAEQTRYATASLLNDLFLGKFDKTDELGDGKNLSNKWREVYRRMGSRLQDLSNKESADVYGEFAYRLKGYASEDKSVSEPDRALICDLVDTIESTCNRFKETHLQASLFAKMNKPNEIARGMFEKIVDERAKEDDYIGLNRIANNLYDVLNYARRAGIRFTKPIQKELKKEAAYARNEQLTTPKERAANSGVFGFFNRAKRAAKSIASRFFG